MMTDHREVLTSVVTVELAHLTWLNSAQRARYHGPVKRGKGTKYFNGFSQPCVQLVLLVEMTTMMQ